MAWRPRPASRWARAWRGAAGRRMSRRRARRPLRRTRRGPDPRDPPCPAHAPDPNEASPRQTSCFLIVCVSQAA
eukprot:10201646-Lingulodinium_polyedra.AAC.1